MSEELPDIYVPSAIRQDPTQARTEVAYAISDYYRAIRRNRLFYGPTTDLQEMLEIVPDSAKTNYCTYPCIIRLNLDGTENVLYVWHQDGATFCWIRHDALHRLSDKGK